MLRPSMNQIIDKNESYYEFVIAVAQRARQIVSEAEDQKNILMEKPVKLAVDEFASGQVKVSDIL